MTIRLRSSVRSTRTSIAGWAWAAVAEDDGQVLDVRAGYAPDHQAALAAAHTALGELHQQLMDEVHESRAARRAARKETAA